MRPSDAAKVRALAEAIFAADPDKSPASARRAIHSATVFNLQWRVFTSTDKEDTDG